MPSDEPSQRTPRRIRPPGFRITSLAPDAPELAALLRGWDWVARSLLFRGVGQATGVRLNDSRRIVGELLRVLCGEEGGEGAAHERRVRAAVKGDRVEAVASVFLCSRATFIELLASAPWNLLGEGDPPDRRTVRGAGLALIEDASALAREGGAHGRVALQAENPRCLALYERFGFSRVRPSDAPLGLVPRGGTGWSPSVLRLARGAPGPMEQRAPWLVLDPDRLAPLSAIRIVEPGASSRRRAAV